MRKLALLISLLIGITVFGQTTLSWGDGKIRGGVTIENSTLAIAGNMRWTGTAFEGYDGATWNAFGGGATIPGSNNQILTSDGAGGLSASLLTAYGAVNSMTLHLESSYGISEMRSMQSTSHPNWPTPETNQTRVQGLSHNYSHGWIDILTSNNSDSTEIVLGITDDQNGYYNIIRFDRFGMTIENFYESALTDNHFITKGYADLNYGLPTVLTADWDLDVAGFSVYQHSTNWNSWFETRMTDTYNSTYVDFYSQHETLDNYWNVNFGSSALIFGLWDSGSYGNEISIDNDWIDIKHESIGNTRSIRVDATGVNINDILKVTPRSSAPTSPTLGMIYVDSTDNHIYFYNGTSWVQMDN